MDNSSDSLVREINEAMRAEKMQSFLRLFGKYIIVLSALILFATMGYVWWQNSKQSQYQKISGKFFHAIELIENEKANKAKPIIDKLAENPDEKIALMAQIWQVKLKYLANKPGEAVAIAEKLMQNTMGKKSLAPYHDWAQLHAKPSVENQTYRLSALEMQAAKHVQNNDMQAANAILQRIQQDEQAPQTMRDRAKTMLSIVK